VRRALLAAVLLLLPAIVQAQTHQCDLATTPTTLSATINQPLNFSACLPPLMADGSPIVTVTGWTIYDNGVSTAVALTKGTTAPVSGKTLYSGPWIAPATAGAHVLQLTATGANASGTAKESPKSVPFTLTLALPPASNPQAPDHVVVAVQ
jgi:hypothetical protein